MKIFFDTEFTGLHKNTSLISIGLIAENGLSFYAELTDYDKTQLDDWIANNVINNLILTDNGIQGTSQEVLFKGDSQSCRHELTIWLSQFDTIEWVSDVCHYDFVLLIDLVYGHALNIPYNKHSACCFDVNQGIASYLSISDIEAFNYSREEFIKTYSYEVHGNKHNALYDAKVIKSIYTAIQPR